MKSTNMIHCKFCGDELSPYGFKKHEEFCKRATNDERAIRKQAREAHLAERHNGKAPTITPGYASTDGKRLRLCISVGLEQIKLLLPFIEIDKVEIA